MIYINNNTLNMKEEDLKYFRINLSFLYASEAIYTHKKEMENKLNIVKNIGEKSWKSEYALGYQAINKGEIKSAIKHIEKAIELANSKNHL